MFIYVRRYWYFKWRWEKIAQDNIRAVFCLFRVRAFVLKRHFLLNFAATRADVFVNFDNLISNFKAAIYFVGVLF